MDKSKMSLAQVVAQMPQEELLTYLDGQDLSLLEHSWGFWGRPDQFIYDDPNIKMWLLLTGRGWGKMLSLDTPVPTPDGWTTMGDIKAGDKVFDENGNICRVTIAHDIDTPEKAYRLTFSDDTYIDAGEEHLWVTWDHAARKNFGRSKDASSEYPKDWVNWTSKDRWGNPKPNAPKMRSTQEIVDTFTYGKRSDRNHSIPLARPLKTPDVDLLIDPYILGYWLGDGTTKGPEFTVHALDEPYLTEALDNAGYPVKRRALDKKNTITYTLSSGKILRSDLRSLDLLGNKHIPSEYMRASVEQRIQLLKGLMDSDGFCDKDSGYVEFCNVLPGLAEQVMELVRSLGEKPRVYKGVSKLNGVEYGPKFRVCWTPSFNCFNLERKSERIHLRDRQGIRNAHRMIVGYKEIPAVPMRCITVDSPNSMYLAGEGMIPTHNSRTMAEWVRRIVKDFPGCRVGILGRANKDVKDVMINGESGILAVCAFDENKATHRPSENKIIWDNGSMVSYFSAEVPDQLRGQQFHFYGSDELASYSQFVGVDGLTAFENLQIATRLGEHPYGVVATTPKRVQVLRDLLAKAAEGGKIKIVRGSTLDNTNLSAGYLEDMLGKFKGTAVERQELEGQMLDDFPEGALWKQSDLDDHRYNLPHPPPLAGIIVAVDPSVAENPKDEAGIIVLGVTGERDLNKRHVYILEDATILGPPDVWAARAVKAYQKWGASAMIVEKNQGGALIAGTIHTIDKNVKVIGISASVGKRLRAEPTVLPFQQGRVHMHGMKVDLETQLTTWEPEHSKKSPDRLDAMVHGITALLIKPPPGLTFRRARASNPGRGQSLPSGIGTGRARSVPKRSNRVGR